MQLKLPGLPGQIMLSVTGMALCSGLAFGMIAWWMASGVNAIERARTIEAMESHLAAEEARAANFTYDYAYWEQAYDWIIAGDADAIYDNLGSTAEEGTLFQQLWITAADGTMLHAFSTPDDSTIFHQEVATQLREQLLALPIPEDETVYQTVSSHMLIDDRLATVSAGPVRPYSLEGVDRSELPILTIVIYVQDSDGTLLIDGTQFPDLVFTPAGAQLPAQSNIRYDLMASDGSPVGVLSWTAARPGDVMFYRAAPVIAALIIILVCVAAILSRAVAKQTTALVHEHMRARRDQLTGLLNRTALDDLVQSEQFQSDLRTGRIALLFVDLNRFKLLNDTMGHLMGDAALKLVAKRMLGSVRNQDFVIRKGGDEFLIILISDDPTNAVTKTAERLLKPLTLRSGDTAPIPLSFAVGGAVSDGTANWTDLLSQADDAMYRAKQSNAGRLVVHSASSMAQAS